MVRLSLLVCATLAFGSAMAADVSVIPLQEDSDPFRLTNARIRFSDADHGVIAVALENRTTQPISTYQILVSASRFLTPSEGEAAKRFVFTCGKMGHLDGAERPQMIAPGGSAAVEFSINLTENCRRDPAHEHFFVYIYLVSASPDGKLREPAWQRTSADFTRLLGAAMPHP